MADVEARLDRMDEHIQALTGIVGELAREVRTLVQGLAADRAAFRETLRELSGFVATAGLELNQLGQRLDRLAEITEVGFTRMQLHLTEQFAETKRLMAEGFAETNRLIAENNRQIADNNRLISESNRRIEENNAVIRRLLDILARGRGDGEGPPP